MNQKDNQQTATVQSDLVSWYRFGVPTDKDITKAVHNIRNITTFIK